MGGETGENLVGDLSDEDTGRVHWEKVLGELVMVAGWEMVVVGRPKMVQKKKRLVVKP